MVVSIGDKHVKIAVYIQAVRPIKRRLCGKSIIDKDTGGCILTCNRSDKTAAVYTPYAVISRIGYINESTAHKNGCWSAECGLCGKRVVDKESGGCIFARNCPNNAAAVYASYAVISRIGYIHNSGAVYKDASRCVERRSDCVCTVP